MLFVFTGHNLKLYDTQELAIEAAWVQANRYQSEVYIELSNGKFQKVKK